MQSEHRQNNVCNCINGWSFSDICVTHKLDKASVTGLDTGHAMCYVAWTLVLHF